MRLETLQAAMMRAIDHGPDSIPDGTFAGGRAAALRGLRIHANTISHARLIALEESFPRTLAEMGHARFNLLSRDYLGWPGASAEPLATIGRHFPAFLVQGGDHAAGLLAAFEWAWLESYHAAEAEPISLADLAGLDETALLAMPLARHPAARLAGAAAILLTRPHAEVLAAPASPEMVRLFGLLEKPQPLCNLLASSVEPDDGDSLKPLFALLEAGALSLSVTEENHAGTL